MGHLVYLGVALKRLFADTFYEVDVTMEDGTKKHFKKAYFVAVMNQPYEGGGFRFCPDAKMDDGLLDVIVVSDIPRLKVLCLLPTAFFGKHTHFKGVDIFQCKEIRVKVDEKAPIHADGQPVAVEDEMKVRVAEQQIRWILPGDEI